MEKQNPTMQWNQTENSLLAALLDLQDIYAKVHFADMGELPEGINRDDLNPDTTLEQGDISEEELFMDGLNGVYLGLDYAWTTRFIDMEKAEEEGGLAFRIAHPTDGVFAALVPDAILGRDESVKFTDKPVLLTPVRMALQIASEKLASLVCRIAQLPEEEEIEVVKDGNETCVRTQIVPYDENDFAKRLAQVYAYINMAWNSRFDKRPVSSPEEVRLRSMYPRETIRTGNRQ